MGPLPISQWQAALDRMESTLAATTKTLERAEERWERAAAPSAGEGELPVAFDRLDSRLQQWEARLYASDELAASTEREIAERAAAVERWRALFAKWEELVEDSRNHAPCDHDVNTSRGA